MVRPVRVLLFASAREAVGRAEFDWAVPAAGVPARDLLAALAAQFPALGRVARSSRVVRNGEYLVTLTERVRPGDEFAIHPPYGGG